MPIDNGFNVDVESWLKTNFANFGDNDSDDNVDDEVHSNDSICCQHSQWKSTCSGKHSHNSAKSTALSRIKAEAEQAALLARAAALKEKNALEAQEDQLRRKREQLDIDAEIPASTAKVAVYQAASECSNRSLLLQME